MRLDKNGTYAGRGKVTLPYCYHLRIHSTYYYDYVNEVISTAWDSGQTSGVYGALFVLKLEIIAGTLW